jgi:hypothetical protein
MMKLQIVWPALICLAVAGSLGAADLQFRHRVVDAHAGTNGVDINVYGDVDGDGLDDIVVAAKGGEVVWYENPTLKRRQIFKAPFKWSCEGELADVDGDKDNDLVLVSWYESKHYWLENPGKAEGEWKLHQFGDGIRGHDVEAADLDEDGRMDMIVRSETWPRVQASAKEVQIWRQEGPDKWTKTSFTTIEGGGIKAADVDRDGDIDIITGGRWYENGGKGLAGNPWTEHIIDDNATTYSKIRFIDINADRRKDIVLTPSESHAAFKERGPVVWYEAPADVKKEKWVKHIVDEDQADLHTLVVADINADGELDIFTGKMHHAEGPLELIVYTGSENGSKWKKNVIATKGTHEGGVIDLHGDGDYDLVGTNFNTNTVDLWENLINAPNQRSFTFFDGVVTFTGQRRLWEAWDFVTRLDHTPGSPKNWLKPVNFADGTLRFRVEVLEMQPVETPVSVHLGWENIPDDPEVRHTAGAPILFSKPGVYETSVPIRKIRSWYGKGPKRDTENFAWDWRHAWTEKKFYMFIQPRKNPKGQDGFPFKVHATVTIVAPPESAAN